MLGFPCDYCGNFLSMGLEGQESVGKQVVEECHLDQMDLENIDVVELMAVL